VAKKLRNGKAKGGKAPRGQESGARGREPGVRDWESEVRNPAETDRAASEDAGSDGALLALLTVREREVLRNFVEECDAKAVARRLGTKVQTVRTRLTSIEEKLRDADLRPHWDKKTRKLSFGGMLVHRLRRPAPVIEMILDAFAEEGWLERIDDPLPPLIGRSEAERLRKEVYALNRRLDFALIHFFMDGTGQGICWELSRQPLGRHQSALALHRRSVGAQRLAFSLAWVLILTVTVIGIMLWRLRP